MRSAHGYARPTNTTFGGSPAPWPAHLLCHRAVPSKGASSYRTSSTILRARFIWFPCCYNKGQVEITSCQAADRSTTAGSLAAVPAHRRLILNQTFDDRTRIQLSECRCSSALDDVRFRKATIDMPEAPIKRSTFSPPLSDLSVTSLGPKSSAADASKFANTAAILSTLDRVFRPFAIEDILKGVPGQNCAPDCVLSSMESTT